MLDSPLRRIVLPTLQRAARAALVIALTVMPAASGKATTVGGPFTLVASDGSVVTDQTYRGKWLLVFFGFTFCPNTCPTTLIEIATAMKQLGPDADALKPIFITIDPQRDTPDVMGEYVRSFDPRIVGLTGDAEQIAAVAREYGVYYAPHRLGPDPGHYVLDHSSYVYLMDPDGAFARGFDGDTPGHRLADAIRETWRNSSWHRSSGQESSGQKPSAP